MPDELPLGRDSVTYRVVLEPITVLVCGPRALLLQVAHPVVGAGVAQHSDYERDPYTRLFRTLQAMTQLSLGSVEQSRQVARTLRRSHATINGELPDGERYRALDPENMRWVWATLLDALIAGHDRFIRPLSRSEREELYAEWLLIAEGCGVPREHCPADYDAFVAYVDETVRGELRATETARGVARILADPPLPGPLGDLAAAVLSVLVPGQLPSALRVDLGLPWGSGRRRTFDVVAQASRAVAAATPGPLRRLPTALVTLGTLKLPAMRPRRRLLEVA